MSQNELPVRLSFWIAALIPILILLVLLVWRRWSSSAAGPVALAAATLIGLFLYKSPLKTLAVAAGKGIWDAIFILYVIWPALILYYVAREADTFAVIKEGLRSAIPDRLLVVLTFAWVLPSFIQGIAGFGTPLAVTVPLLIGLGVQPLYAVVLPLIGRAWGNMFGSLGVTWFATLSVVSINDPQRTIMYTAIMLWIANLMGGLVIAWFYGGWWAIKRGAVAIGLISLVHGGLQLLLTPIIPAMGNFIATAVALVTPFILSQFKIYQQEDEDEPQRIFTEESIRNFKHSNETKTETEAETPRMSLLSALAPYLILAVLAIVVLLIPPVRDFLEQDILSVGLPFPATETGYGVTRPAVDVYASFTPLTHPGTLLLISSIAGFIYYKSKGFYDKKETAGFILKQAVIDALPSTTAITALLLISKVMDHTGQITVLALGVAEVAPQVVLVAATPFIGMLGALITSSNTASNVLFAPLQATAAQAAGIAVPIAIAGQSAGGATGNAIAPGDALLGAAVAQMSDDLGKILAKALPWTLVTGALISATAVLIHLFVGGAGG